MPKTSVLPRSTQKMAKSNHKAQSDDLFGKRRPSELTERERDVLRLFSRGHTYQEIGEELEISPKTVGSYLQRVREKARAKTRADLISLALKEGLVSDR
jgi:RNA polymerase sigma factor (sigma-70 family)